MGTGFGHHRCPQVISRYEMDDCAYLLISLRVVKIKRKHSLTSSGF